MSASAKMIIAAVRKRGSDARDLRDAAHEACHALQADMKRAWDREALHRKLVNGKGNGDLVILEVQARAVEQIVCADLGVDCGAVEHWADVAWWETAKNMRIQLPSVEWVTERVREHMKSRRCRDLADRVIALGDKP